MGTTVKGRRLVDAVDDVVRELRVANLLKTIELGTSALDFVDPAKSSDVTARRQRRLNRARAQIRAALELEDGAGHGDHD